METAQPEPAAENEPTLKYAGFQQRMMATIIDMTIVGILLAIINPHLLVGSEDVAIPQDRVALLIAFIWNCLLQSMIFVGFNIFCWIKWGTTPGKAITALRVIDVKTGYKPDSKKLIIRGLAYFISLIPFMLGFFWIGFNRQKLGWHDKIAGTAVILDWSHHRNMVDKIWQFCRMVFSKISGR